MIKPEHPEYEHQCVVCESTNFEFYPDNNWLLNTLCKDCGTWDDIDVGT